MRSIETLTTTATEPVRGTTHAKVPQGRRPPRLARLGASQAVCFTIAIGLFAIPLLYMAMQGFKAYPDFLRNPTGLPSTWTTESFSTAWAQGDFARQMINSLIYAVIPTAITLVLGVFLAFPVSRGYFRYSNAIYAFFIFSGFLPGALIPLFIMVKALHMHDSMFGYLVLNSLGGAGFFFFVGYIKGIPRELDEAAAMDGCGYTQFIFTIIIPHMRPALATFGIFGFVASWNNLILPLVMLPSPELWPVTRGLFGFFGEHTQKWPLIAAGTVIVAAPILIVFAVLQRFLVEGVAGGAVSGTQGVTQSATRAAVERR